MEKAIEIKRRAQRCIQNGDLDGALTEYEKLVGAPESDPYNYVLLADLLYKKGDQGEAAERYLSAVTAYQSASLYKNAIAVCKKMVRLSLSPAKVLHSLATLHALDGLAGEAALYYVQYAEHLVRSNAPADAAGALRRAFDVSQENVRVLEQLSEAWLLAGENDRAAEALAEAAQHYRERSAEADAKRCEERASALAGRAVVATARVSTTTTTVTTVSTTEAGTATETEPAPAEAAAGTAEAGFGFETHSHVPDADAPAPVAHAPLEIETASLAPLAGGTHARMDDIESGRHHGETPAAGAREPEAPAASHAEHGPGDAPDDPPARTVAGEPDGAHDHPVAQAPEADEPGDRAFEIPDDAAEAEHAHAGTFEDHARAFDVDPPVTAHDVAAEAAEAVHAQADDSGVYEISDDDGSVYEIAADGEPAPEAPAAEAAPHAHAADEVYEIEIADETDYASAAAEAAVAAGEPAADVVYDLEAETPVEAPAEVHAETPGSDAPGLAFEPPPAPAPPSAEEEALAQVEALLVCAQDQFRGGDRDEASMTLARAAQVCETIGRLDNAASIYRSLGRGPHATPVMLQMWLANCEHRRDAAEAAQVACELGDRALNEGDQDAARDWFGKALAFDAGNETALRRLHRLEQVNGGASAGGVAFDAAEAPAAPAPAAPQPAPEPAAAEGRVEVAVGRAQAVSFDLAGLLAEFQRGVEAQLAGDAQSHYDLGMTYREMGLLDQAMDSFRSAEQDAAFAARALEMVGRCLADQGRLAEAVEEFERALALPTVTPENDVELRYWHGIALAGLGRDEEALAEFERVQAQLPGFEDVEQSIADLHERGERAA